VDAVNENWPTVTCDIGGSCNGDAANTWVPTDTALRAGLSIVIHDTVDKYFQKMFCADLAPVQEYVGKFSELPSFTSQTYEGSTGTAELLVASYGIETEVFFRGPALGEKTFKAHLHSLPCRDRGGGGHYQNPLGNGSVDAVNENWPTVTCDSSGSCTGRAANTWVPTDAALRAGLSIVIHDTAVTFYQKMFCADLELRRPNPVSNDPPMVGPMDDPVDSPTASSSFLAPIIATGCVAAALFCFLCIRSRRSARRKTVADALHDPEFVDASFSPATGLRDPDWVCDPSGEP
jgi:hypothetical protein